MNHTKLEENVINQVSDNGLDNDCKRTLERVADDGAHGKGRVAASFNNDIQKERFYCKNEDEILDIVKGALPELASLNHPSAIRLKQALVLFAFEETAAKLTDKGA